MPMFEPVFPNFGILENRMQNEFGGIESRIRHDMGAMDNSFARIEHSIGENLRNMDKMPMQDGSHSESFSYSSEKDMGPDGKIHQHAEKDGSTTSCQDGQCQKITCSDGECEMAVVDEKTGKEFSDSELEKRHIEEMKKMKE